MSTGFLKSVILIMITVDRSGTFGNNVWQYAIARTLSENIGMKLKFIDSNAHQWMSDANRFPDADFPDYMKSSWIRGLPNTKMEIDGNVVDESINKSVLLDNKNNLFSVSQNTNIKIPIHFENYDYIKHNKEKFKEWFKVDSKITPRIKPEPNDVVLSIRRGWAGYPESLCPPHEYFSKLLKKIDYAF